MPTVARYGAWYGVIEALLSGGERKLKISFVRVKAERQPLEMRRLRPFMAVT